MNHKNHSSDFFITAAVFTLLSFLALPLSAATISGRVLFDRVRTASPPGSMAGIANVPVVLQNVSNNFMLAVLTDANGNFAFTNVPDGNYLLVEAYGTAPTVPTPGNFISAVWGTLPAATVPPISFAPSPPAGATHLDCLSPNTMAVTIVSNMDVANLFILNGPVKYTPIDTDKNVDWSVNLITEADNGTFGAFPAGTPANTSVPSAPYPAVVPDYAYVLTAPGIHVPDANEYTVQNLLTNTQSTTIGAWWRIADRTTGNEKGRMAVINGEDPGKVFFTQTVTVAENTDYLFGAWILNLFKSTGWANPEIGVTVKNSSNQVIIQKTLDLIQVNTSFPEWKQIGAVINSGNNTSLTVQLTSEAPQSITGNDFAIDDVFLFEILPFDLTISGGTPGADYTYTGGVLTIIQNGAYTIGMAAGVTITTDRIVVNAGLNAVNITLDGVKIDVSATADACAFDMTGATVNLSLVGSNELKSGDNRAGLQAPNGATLTIGGTGELKANGGAGGAGIGGGFEESGGNIHISGGTVEATGKGATINNTGAGAGIGSGGGLGSGIVPNFGSITISNNAQVTAKGGDNLNQGGGAGIGTGGSGGGSQPTALGTITITTSGAVSVEGGAGNSGRDGAAIGFGGTATGRGTELYGLIFDAGNPVLGNLGGKFYLDVSGSGTTGSNPEYTGQAGAWSWTNPSLDPGILKLNGFAWTTMAETALRILNNHITLELTAATVNAFTSVCTAGAASYGIYHETMDIIITGNGALYAAGGTAQSSCGIISSFSITVQSGDIHAAGGVATLTGGVASSGISAQGNITITGGNVMATGDAANIISSGISATGSITVSGGTLEASGSAGSESYGIQSQGGLNITGGAVTAQGVSQAISGAAGTLPSLYRYRTNTSPTDPGSSADITVPPGTAFSNSASFKFVRIETPPQLIWNGPASAIQAAVSSLGGFRGTITIEAGASGILDVPAGAIIFIVGGANGSPVLNNSLAAGDGIGFRPEGAGVIIKWQAYYQSNEPVYQEANGAITGSFEMVGGSITRTGTGDRAIQSAWPFCMESGIINGEISNNSASGITVTGGEINNPSGNAIRSNAFYINGATTINGALDVSNFINIVGPGAVTIPAGGALTILNNKTLNNDGSLTVNGSFSSNGSINNNGSITVNGSLSGTSAITNNGTITFNSSANQTTGNNITGSGSLVKEGTGTLTLTGTNSYSGGTTINVGTISINAANRLGTGAITLDGGTLSVSSPVTMTNLFTLGANGGTIDIYANSITLSGVISGSGSLVIEGTGTLTPTGANTCTGGTTINGGTVSIDAANRLGTGAITLDGGTLSASIGGIIMTNSLIVGVNSGTIAGSSLSLTGNISGPGGLVVEAIQLTLLGNITCDGSTTINSSRTLQIGDGGTTGSISGPVVNNGRIEFFRFNDFIFDGDISGSGNLSKAGAGTLTLNGNLTYTGNTTIFNGTLTFGSDYTLKNGKSLDAMTSGGALSAASGVSLTLEAGSQVQGVDGLFIDRGTTLSVGSATIVSVGAANAAPSSTALSAGVYTWKGTAFEKTFDLIITGGTLGADYTYAGGVLTIIQNGAYTIGMASGITTTADRIAVDPGVTADITLDGVKIINPSAAITFIPAFDMTGATVNLTLTGDNLLKSEHNTGLLAPSGATLTITAISTGSLTAEGVNSAGIGGGQNQSGGIITINGGTVIASSEGGAGIGGGIAGDGGNITINGGHVTATGTQQGAGIGGGDGGDGGNITITGGIVIASATQNAAGIGGGSAGHGGNITISGGTITATGAGNAAGIGAGGFPSYATLPGTRNILIYGENTVVTATKGTASGNQQDIGAGNNSQVYNVFVALPLGNLKNSAVNIGNPVAFSATPVSNGTVSATLPAPFDAAPFTAGGIYNLLTDLTTPKTLSIISTVSVDFILPGYPDVPKSAAELTTLGETVAFIQPVYAIALNPSANHDFGTALAGYPAPTAHSVTITNTGNQPTGQLTIALTGANAANFTLSGASITDISVGFSANFTVTPNTGLAAGTYTATVTVTGSAISGISESFDVTFTVNQATITPTWYNFAIRAEAGGSIIEGSDGDYEQGDVISIAAVANSGYLFNGWTSSGGGSFDNANSATTTFIMPANDVTVTATFRAMTLQESWAAAVALIEANTFTLTQQQAPDAATARFALADRINELIKETGFTIKYTDIVMLSFTSATAGNTDTPAGIAGKFEFRVTPSGVPTSAYSSGTIAASPVGNEQLTMDNGQLKAYVQNGILYVSGLKTGEKWSVYNILGTLVHTATATDGKAEIPLPARGIYIVTNGTQTIKIMY